MCKFNVRLPQLGRWTAPNSRTRNRETPVARLLLLPLVLKPEKHQCSRFLWLAGLCEYKQLVTNTQYISCSHRSTSIVVFGHLCKHTRNNWVKQKLIFYFTYPTQLESIRTEHSHDTSTKVPTTGFNLAAMLTTNDSSAQWPQISLWRKTTNENNNWVSMLTRGWNQLIKHSLEIH